LHNTADARRGRRRHINGPVSPQSAEVGRQFPSSPLGLPIKNLAHASRILLFIIGFLLFNPSGGFCQMPYSAPMRVSRSETDDKLRAIESLRELVRREPSNIGYRVRLGWWLVEVNELQEAGKSGRTVARVWRALYRLDLHFRGAGGLFDGKLCLGT